MKLQIENSIKNLTKKIIFLTFKKKRTNYGEIKDLQKVLLLYMNYRAIMHECNWHAEALKDLQQRSLGKLLLKQTARVKNNVNDKLLKKLEKNKVVYPVNLC